MKKILIATDFSVAADDAARYAITLAGIIHSDTMLIHAAAVTTDSPVEILWPTEDYKTLIERNIIRLKDLSDELLKNLITVADHNQAIPKIGFKSELGSITDLLRETVHEESVGLVVMGLSGAGNIKRFILGSSSRDVIDSAGYPVLLIPKGTLYKPIHKIAFATDLGLADMESIKLVANFAALLNAQLLIVHVIGEKIERNTTHHIEAFLAELKNKINYDQIYYENVYSIKIEDGLNWLKNHGETDLLVMLHRKCGVINDFIRGSHSQNMARQTQIPLLVLPEGYNGALC